MQLKIFSYRIIFLIKTNKPDYAFVDGSGKLAGAQDKFRQTTKRLVHEKMADKWQYDMMNCKLSTCIKQQQESSASALVKFIKIVTDV